MICYIHVIHLLTNSLSVSIMLDSVVSDDGKNPDGTPFQIMELLYDDVLEGAVQKLNGAMTVEELRSHLTVSDAMTQDSYKQLEKSIADGENENTYFPTCYFLTYSTITEHAKEDGFFSQCKDLFWGFAFPSKEAILNAVVISYQEYYSAKYLNYDAVYNIDWSVVDAMDYYNRFEYLKDISNQFIRFLQFKGGNDMAQNESNTNTGFDDLANELYRGVYHNIGDSQAYVIQNGITNDISTLLRQFSYMQSFYEEENIRKLEEYKIIREAIDMYDSSTTRVVFIPALDDNNSFYMNRTKVGLDYLTEKADSTKTQAESAEYSAKHYAYLQTCFGDKNESSVSGKNTIDQRNHADGLYKGVKAELLRMIEKIKLMTDERMVVNRETVHIGEPFVNVSLVGIGMSTAKKFVILMMAAYVIVFIVYAAFDEKQKNTGEGENDSL